MKNLKQKLNSMGIKGKVICPNPTDLKENFWGRVFLIEVSRFGMPYLVNAASTQEAFDFIIDHAEEHAPGLVSAWDEFDNDQERDEYISGGDHGLYLNTHNICCREITV